MVVEKSQGWSTLTGMEVLDILDQETRRLGKSPTRRELMKSLDLKSPASVQVHLKSLAEKGMISFGKKGCTILSPYGRVSLGFFRARMK